MEEKKKPEFVPHLECDWKNYGIIGEPTLYKDAVGRSLFVGDTVDLFRSNGEYFGEAAIVKTIEEGTGIVKTFVMGICSGCDHRTGEITPIWRIVKKRSFRDITHGEVVEWVKYVLKEG